MLEEIGDAKIIDADEIAHQVQAPGGTAYKEIVSAFGPDVTDIDGTLNRKKLGAIVFSDPAERQKLNDIVHPKVRTEELRLLREYRHLPLVVLMVPLLLENKMESMVDSVVVVTVDEEARRDRLLKRSNLTPEQIEQRLAAQMPEAQKIRLADYVIDNSGSLEKTREQVQKLVEQVRHAALNG